MTVQYMFFEAHDVHGSRSPWYWIQVRNRCFAKRDLCIIHAPSPPSSPPLSSLSGKSVVLKLFSARRKVRNMESIIGFNQSDTKSPTLSPILKSPDNHMSKSNTFSNSSCLFLKICTGNPHVSTVPTWSIQRLDLHCLHPKARTRPVQAHLIITTSSLLLLPPPPRIPSLS